jgi:CheY-like chemotaxis protein
MRALDSLYVVDDDAMYQYIAKQTIESAGYTGAIHIFSNGLEAISAIQENAGSSDKLPDMIMLDLNMPVMDGWGFLKNYELIKPRVAKEILIYIVTSSFNPLDVNRAKSISDVTGYVVKPITRQKFLDLLA